MKTYTAVIEQEADGGYSAYVPDLPGCASMGDSYEDALTNIREAITCYLEGLRAEGLSAPEPHTHVVTVDVDAA